MPPPGGSIFNGRSGGRTRRTSGQGTGAIRGSSECRTRACSSASATSARGNGLDIKPYVASTTFDAPGGAVPTSLETSADVGVDLFYNLTPDLRANLTLNTDFAQIEVDQRLVNLTRFPLFFPEKRDFFLDGSTFFVPEQSTGAVRPFFSRRIGLDENGVPQQIDVGAKLTGQVGAHDVGFLQVRTGEERDAVGEDFTVFRLKRRLLTQSYVGTFYSRRQARGPLMPDDLQTAGFDFHLETSTFRESKTLEFSGYIFWATNPLNTGDNLAYTAQLAYPNDRWNGRFLFMEVQPNHDPAIGFVPRRGFRQYLSILHFGPRPGPPSLDPPAEVRQQRRHLDRSGRPPAEPKSGLHRLPGRDAVPGRRRGARHPEL